MKKFKKSILICLSIFFLFGASSGFSKVYHFTYSCLFPLSNNLGKLAYQWCKEVEKRTHGQVKITFYPGCTLTKPAQVYDGVITGRSDIGQSCLIYTRGRFPLMSFIHLPFGNPSGEFATAIINEVYNRFKPKELDDVKVLYLHAHGPGLIHLRNKPVFKLADFKGLKIRTPGAVADMIKALGAIPLSMPMPELYQSLQRGVVDGAVFPEEAAKGWKLAEVTHYTVVAYPIAYSVGFFVVMNKKKWEELPKNIQKIIDEIDREWIIKTGKTWDMSDYDGIKFSLSLGNQIIGIPPKEAKKWKEKVRVVIDNYIKMTESKGLPGKKVIDFLFKSLKEYKEGKFKSPYISHGY